MAFKLILCLALLAFAVDEPEVPTDASDISPEILEQVESAADQHEFQADVARTMDIFINSLYKNKEVFLRETISNASDALDKLRYMSISDDSVLGEGEQRRLEIRVEYNKDEGTLSIADTGIGMTKEDLIKNLGTVAKSGTTNFVEALAAGGDINLIGQFGVGFYSNFLVADQIIVTSKHNDDEQHVWVSNATNTFSVFKDPRGNTLGRGTRITLKLKEDSKDFLLETKIKKILQKYSEFVNYPIYLRVKKDVSREVPMTEEELAELEQYDTTTTKIVKEKVWEWEIVNENKPIWLRDDVEHSDYVEFYKTITKDNNEPLSYIHFTAEGEIEFKALLYIPSEAPYDSLQNHYDNKGLMKLYVRRVLITEEFEDLVPRYLNFVRGVVDSDDLPLNVARQDLQQKKILKLINKKIVRKILQELIDMANDIVEEDEVHPYDTFYDQFGKNVKLGVIEDQGNKTKLSRLLRFYSTKDADKLTSLDDYIYRMKDGQEDIYFIAGEDRYQLQKSPIIQKLVRLGYEVLLLDDPIDEYTIDAVGEYEQHKLQNVARDDWKLPDDDDMERRKEKSLKKMFNIMTDWLKGLNMGASRVEITRKLHEEPGIVTTNDQGYSANMERISKAQTLSHAAKHQSHNASRKTWEVNPAHPMIKKLEEYSRTLPSDKEPRAIANTMYDVALLQSGFVLNNPIDYYQRAMGFILDDMGISRKDEIREPELDIKVEDFEAENLDDKEL